MDIGAIIAAGGVSAAAVVLAFGFYRGLLAANIIPRLTRNQGFLVVLLLVGGSFLIAVLAITMEPGAGSQRAAGQEQGEGAGGSVNFGTQVRGTTVSDGSTVTINNQTGGQRDRSPQVEAD